MRHRKTFDDRMNEGGAFFYLVAILGAFGLYALVWLVMILGTIAGF